MSSSAYVIGLGLLLEISNITFLFARDAIYFAYSPSDNPSSSSVPRICWNKYHLHEGGKVTIKLNITVNHSLVDGYPLSKAFLKVQEMLDNVDEYIK